MTADEAAKAWDKAEREGTLKGDPVPYAGPRNSLTNQPVNPNFVITVNKHSRTDPKL